MAPDMSRIVIVGLIVCAAVLTGVTIALLGDTLSGERMLPEPPDFNNFDDLRDDVGGYLPIKTAISAINVVLSGVLIILYTQIYVKIKTRFALGLILAMASLFLYALTSNPVVQMLLGYRAITGIGPFAWIADIFASVALVILLWLSLE